MKMYVIKDGTNAVKVSQNKHCFIFPSSGASTMEATSFATFAHLLDGRILRALGDLGFGRPTLVQAKAIPLALDSRDILCRARTGSGKTSYCIPLVQKILKAKAVRVT
jgi:ATP-dependent RNA helicase DDX56/DBP9